MVAVACASGLVIVTLASIFGLARAGSVLLILGFGTSPMDDVDPLPGLELADVFFAAGFLLLIPRFVGTALRLPNGFLIGGVGFLMVGSLSALVTDPPLGVNFSRWMVVVLGALIVPALLVWWRPGRRTTMAAASAYMLGTSVSVAACLFEDPPDDRYLGLTSHPNIMGQSQALAFALVPFLVETVPQRYRWIVGTGSLVSLYGIWISGSRTALVCAVALTLLYPLFKRSIPAALAVAAFCVPAIVIVARAEQNPDPTSPLGRLLGAGSATGSNQERMAGARAGIDQFLTHPLLGDGWSQDFQAHSVYINVAAAIGLFGLFFYLMMLASILRPLVAVPRPYGLLAVPGVLAAGAFGLLDPGVGNRYVWCVLALALSANRLAALAPGPRDPVNDSAVRSPERGPFPTGDRRGGVLSAGLPRRY